MRLLPEFSDGLGTGAFSATSLHRLPIYKDLRSSSHKLIQGVAASGLAGLFIGQGFITSGAFSWDPTGLALLWTSIVSLGAAVASVVGLNVYLAALRQRTMLASTLGDSITFPSAYSSTPFNGSSENTGGTISTVSADFGPSVASPLVAGFRTFGLLREALRPVERRRAEKTLLSPTIPTLPVQTS